MKKITALLILVVMLCTALISCGGGGFDYRTEDLTPYVTLAPYESERLQAVIAELAALITDADVNEEIDDALIAGKAYLEKLKEGTIAYGDTIGLTYKGVLVSVIEAQYPDHGDGTGLTDDQIKNLTAFEGGEAKTEQELTIGSGRFVEGFESAMVGMTIGSKNQPIKITFPEDYSSADLAGKEAIFFVSPTYKLKLEPERELAFKDVIAMTYEIHLAEGYEAYEEYFDDETEEPQTGVYTLSQDSQFHSALILAFNALAEGSRFGTEMNFTETHVISVPNADDTGKEDKEIKVDYTVTVHSLSMPLYFTHAEAADGTLSFEDFLGYLDLDEEDYEGKTYTDFFNETKEEMQKQRDLQITANRYQGAFDALVEASDVRLDDPKIRELVQAYQDEVRGNIEYMTTFYRASGYASLYEQLAVSYGLTGGLEEYVMYTLYGYKKSTIDKELATDAEEYVAGRLVFWQLVKTKNITLSDAEYASGVEKYKDLYENDNFIEDNNLTEEQIREALLWDKVAQMLTEYTDFTEKPAKEEEED